MQCGEIVRDEATERECKKERLRVRDLKAERLGLIR